jgi:3-hydroxybutyryl-CoA dehydrogenase
LKNTMTAPVLVVVGGGRMGGDIAAQFAAGGWQVHAVETAAAVRATFVSRTRAALRAMRAPAAAARQIVLHEGLDPVPWRSADLVLESISEVLAPKQRLMASIEPRVRRSTILATNSSSLLPSKIFARVDDRRRTAAIHFMTPAHRVPMVEVVRAPGTTAATIRRIDGWLRALGKLPVHLASEIPGMIVNRLQHAMMREALALIEAGVTDVESIDRAVRFGFGFRYLAAGPLAQRDMNGLMIHWQSARELYPLLSTARRPAKLFDRLIANGHVGLRAGRGFHRWDKVTTPAKLARYDRLITQALALLEAELRTRRP